MCFRLYFIIWVALCRWQIILGQDRDGKRCSQAAQIQMYKDSSFLHCCCFNFFKSTSQGTASKCQHQPLCTWPILWMHYQLSMKICLLLPGRMYSTTYWQTKSLSRLQTPSLWPIFSNGKDRASSTSNMIQSKNSKITTQI